MVPRRRKNFAECMLKIKFVIGTGSVLAKEKQAAEVQRRPACPRYVKHCGFWSETFIMALDTTSYGTIRKYDASTNTTVTYRTGKTWQSFWNAHSGIRIRHWNVVKVKSQIRININWPRSAKKVVHVPELLGRDPSFRRCPGDRACGVPWTWPSPAAWSGPGDRRTIIENNTKHISRITILENNTVLST